MTGNRCQYWLSLAFDCAGVPNFATAARLCGRLPTSVQASCARVYVCYVGASLYPMFCSASHVSHTCRRVNMEAQSKRVYLWMYVQYLEIAWYWSLFTLALFYQSLIVYMYILKWVVGIIDLSFSTQQKHLSWLGCAAPDNVRCKISFKKIILWGFRSHTASLTQVFAFSFWTSPTLTPVVK